MQCPSCQHENPAGQKFCGECGGRLVASSAAPPVANAAAPTHPAPSERFASPAAYTPKHLAEKILTSKGALEGERKQVTVMFTDVSGFTAMSERLDPEEVHAIMDRAFEVIMNAVHRYEGTINQFLGDGVMALFGAPIAHEDHASRALSAALTISRDLRPLGEEVKRLHGRDFLMRIGINTGPVVVGAIGRDLRMDYTAVGDTTSRARRTPFARTRSREKAGGGRASRSRRIAGSRRSSAVRRSSLDCTPHNAERPGARVSSCS